MLGPTRLNVPQIYSHLVGITGHKVDDLPNVSTRFGIVTRNSFLDPLFACKRLRMK